MARMLCPSFALGSGFVEAGGLASYSISSKELAARTMTYVARILNGARPQSLPVEPLAAFQLALNLKIARALEVDLPDALLGRADALLQ